MNPEERLQGHEDAIALATSYVSVFALSDDGNEEGSKANHAVWCELAEEILDDTKRAEGVLYNLCLTIDQLLILFEDVGGLPRLRALQELAKFRETIR